MNYPNTLYKYSSFKIYSLGMIKKGYVYFSPANKLDDQFECLLNWEKYLEKYEKHQIEYVSEIVCEVINEFGVNTSGINFEDFFDNGRLNEKRVNEVLLKEYNVDTSYAQKSSELLSSFQNMLLPVDLEEVLKKVVLMQDYIGIFSMAEEKTNQVLWSMYANNYNGYCIEYDIEKFIASNPNFALEMYKVKYEENRKNDLIKELLRLFYKKLFEGIIDVNVNNVEVDLKKVLVNIAITKGIDWSFQKEWRLIGTPYNTDLKLPISAVYIGNKLSKYKRNRIIKVCRKNGIDVYDQINNYETLKIEFRKIT